MNTHANRFCGNPPVHPVAYHAGHVQESLRINQILRDAWSDTVHAWHVYRKHREDRAAFQHLLALDDRMLSDIGVTRADVQDVNALPLSVNASIELEIRARKGRN